MEILTDFDIYANALQKCNLNETVMPYVRGVLVEDIVTYNKIQKILNTDEMESCHKFLYNLDVEELTEDDVQRVNNLYKLGVDRGFIADAEDSEDDEDASEETKDDEDTNQTDETSDDEKVEECDVTTNVPSAQPSDKFTNPNSAFTVMYSAMKDGNVKVGEAYSNAINPRSAKADILSKLANCGYTNITILAIEAGDPDCVNCQPTEFNKAPIPTTVQPSVPQKIDVFTVEDDKETTDDEDSEDDEETNNDNEEDTEDTEESNEEDTENNEESSEENSEDDEESNEEDTEVTSDDTSDDTADDTTDDQTEELSTAKKKELASAYTQVFKSIMKKLKFKTSFEKLTLDDKIKFFTEMSKAWTKEDPSLFLTTKEQDQLEAFVPGK